MDGKKLLSGIAAVLVLVGCQPSTQGGGATPSGMPADTMMTDTTSNDTLTAAALDGGAPTATALASLP